MRINWSDITISGKELIAVVIFIFSMSGIYYKLFYNNDMQKKQMDSYIKITDARLDAIETNQKTQNQIFDAQLLLLMDDYKARRAVDEYRKSGEFVPLIKNK